MFAKQPSAANILKAKSALSVVKLKILNATLCTVGQKHVLCVDKNVVFIPMAAGEECKKRSLTITIKNYIRILASII